MTRSSTSQHRSVDLASGLISGFTHRLYLWENENEHDLYNKINMILFGVVAERLFRERTVLYLYTECRRPACETGGNNDTQHGLSPARESRAARSSTDSGRVSLRASERTHEAPWLILPVVICLSQRLSHACLSACRIKVKPRMAH